MVNDTLLARFVCRHPEAVLIRSSVNVKERKLPIRDDFDDAFWHATKKRQKKVAKKFGGLEKSPNLCVNKQTKQTL